MVSASAASEASAAREVRASDNPTSSQLEYRKVKGDRYAHELHFLSVLNLLVYEPCI